MEQREFPVTRISVVEGLRSDDPDTRQAAANVVARAYWTPIVATLRARWRMELADAEDLAQDFLAEALLKEWLARYDPARARFRTFLRMCLDRFAANALDAGLRPAGHPPRFSALMSGLRVVTLMPPNKRLPDALT